MDSHDFYQRLVGQMLSAPEDQIRTILMSLCADESIGKKAIARYTELLTKEEAGTGNGTKRKATEDLRFCFLCENVFSEKENKQGACRYHTGASVWDSGAEVWEQFDLYDDWRDVDDEENRIEYPEGFQWTCCGKAHDDPGCVFDEHDPTDGTKRMKESEPDNVVNLVSDEEDDDGDEDEDESDSEDVE